MPPRFNPGDRVYLESDNNGPIWRGVVSFTENDVVTVRWDDGLLTPIHENTIRPDPHCADGCRHDTEKEG